MRLAPVATQAAVGFDFVIPDATTEFVETLRPLLGENLIAVVLVGSFARGDERPGSDIDLFVLVTQVNLLLLRAMGALVRDLESPNEINPAVVSIDELSGDPNGHDLLKIRHDGIVLYGEVPSDIVTVESELMLAKRIAREVLMTSRHYLAVGEPSEAFAGGKLLGYILKPLGFALRFYHFAETGCYIRPIAELRQKYPILALDPVKDHEAVIADSLSTCEMILGA